MPLERRSRLVLAGLHYESALIVGAVGVSQGLLVVLVEEVLGAKVLQIFVDPVQQALVALGYGRSDGVGVAKLVDAYNVLRAALLGEGDNLGVVVCPYSVGVVLECGLSSSVGAYFSRSRSLLCSVR